MCLWDNNNNNNNCNWWLWWFINRKQKVRCGIRSVQMGPQKVHYFKHFHFSDVRQMSGKTYFLSTALVASRHLEYKVTPDSLSFVSGRPCSHVKGCKSGGVCAPHRCTFLAVKRRVLEINLLLLDTVLGLLLSSEIWFKHPQMEFLRNVFTLSW